MQIKTVALLYEDSGWGQSWSANIKPLLEKLKYDLVADLSYPKDSKDLRSYLLKLKAANPDLTIMESYTGGCNLTGQKYAGIAVLL